MSKHDWVYLKKKDFLLNDSKTLQKVLLKSNYFVSLDRSHPHLIPDAHQIKIIHLLNFSFSVKKELIKILL